MYPYFSLNCRHLQRSTRPIEECNWMLGNRWLAMICKKEEEVGAMMQRNVGKLLLMWLPLPPL
jgi:hypothetical protein